MNKILKVFFPFALALAFLISPVYAITYSVSDIAIHNSTSNCWVIYAGKVYDITNYLSTHDTRYYFIDSWCGTDMTSAYDTKDGQGQGHKLGTTTNILSAYYIGDISSIVTTSIPTSTPEVSMNTNTITPTIKPDTSNIITTTKNPYDFWPAFLVTAILLWGSFILSKTSFWKLKFSPLTYNMIWNTMLILSLIPSAFFGLFMILQYSAPSLAGIDFNFLYWHVEGSICFAVIVISHTILRLKIYFTQIKSTFSKGE